MERMGLDDVKKMFGHIADAVMAQESLLTEIDEKIGGQRVPGGERAAADAPARFRQ